MKTFCHNYTRATYRYCIMLQPTIFFELRKHDVKTTLTNSEFACNDQIPTLTDTMTKYPMTVHIVCVYYFGMDKLL